MTTCAGAGEVKGVPVAAPRPCTKPGCSSYATQYGRCDKHQRIGWQTDRRRGSRHERGYGNRWQKLRAAVLMRDDYLCKCGECQESGLPREAHEVDHVVPKAQGGTDRLDNLQAINRECHRRKTLQERREGGQ